MNRKASPSLHYTVLNIPHNNKLVITMICTISSELKCVLSLGICFMILSASRMTMENLEKTIVSSIQDERSGFDVEGYTMKAILYTMFSLVLLLLAPYVSHAIGPRFTMFVCSLGLVFPTAFYLLETSWLTYCGAMLTGMSLGILWPSQSRYIVQNSSPQNIPRNSSIFWLIYTSASLFGNICVYFSFYGQKYIDRFTRRTSLYCLVAINAAAVIAFAFLPKSINKSDGKRTGPIEMFKVMWSLSKEKRVMWLCVYLIYAGLQQSLWSGIYSASVGFTLAYGDSVKELVALSGMSMSVGAMLGSTTCIVLSGWLTRQRFARRLLVTLGGLASLCTFLIAFLNLPDDAVFGNTNQKSIITPPSVPLVLLGGVCSCFGDAIVNTQLYSIFGQYYREQCTEVSALYRFVKNIFLSMTFFWCNHLGLHTQLLIMAVMTVLGVMSFWVADWHNIPRCLEEEQPKGNVEQQPESVKMTDY